MEGLQPREELLVKSFIRLLDHLTHQQWRYQPPDGKTHIHLLLAAPGTSEAFAARYGKLPAALLELGHGHLSWPLRPDVLERELNRLGSLATTQRADTTQADTTQANSAQLLTGMLLSQTQPLQTPTGAMRLKQWPSSHLLSGPGRMRLATLLTGQPMDVDELVRRSKLERRICQTFVNDLQHAGLLHYATSVQPAPTIGSQATQPLPASSSMPQEVRTAIAAKPALASAGLLNRIRIRLGIGKLRG
ncbi:MAG: hypothetical protein EAZ34_01780 [Polaromonas sp.]|nr:MAG: hypothetical protein EAZ34_01780 [Polaromonas sp.]